MNNETKEIDLIQFCLYLRNRIIVVMIVAFLGAAVFMGYNYHKQKSVTPVEYSRSVISTIVSQNRTAYYSPNNLPQPYTYDAIPSGAYNSSAKIFIDFNYNIFDNSNTFDTAAMSAKLQSDLYLVLVSNTSLQEVIDQLDLNSYEDMKDITPDTLRWMISGSLNGSNIMEIFVTDSNPERAQLIAAATIERFIVISETIESIDSVKIVDSPSRPVVDFSLSSYSTPFEIDSFFKSGLIGFIIGFILVASFYFAFFIIVDPIMNDINFGDLSVKTIGKISSKENQIEKDVKRIANNIHFFSTSKKIIYISVDNKTEEYNFASNISDALKDLDKDYCFFNPEIIMDNPDIILKIKEFEGVVLGVTCGITKKKDLKLAVDEVRKTGKEFLGIIINNKK